jgi:hypothetical protein
MRKVDLINVNCLTLFLLTGWQKLFAVVVLSCGAYAKQWRNKSATPESNDNKVKDPKAKGVYFFTFLYFSLFLQTF